MLSELILPQIRIGVKAQALVLYLFLSVFIPTISDSQWLPTDIPASVQVFSIACADSNVWVGTDSAVYLSNDGGFNWLHPTNIGMAIREVVYSFAFVDSFAFAGTSSHGIFRSSDLGAHWSAVNVGLPARQVLTLVMGDSGIFAGTNNGVFFSTNLGLSWQAVNNGIVNPDIFSLAISQQGVNPPIIYAGAVESGIIKGSFYVSSNEGSAWMAMNYGLVDSSIYALAVGGGQNIYAGTFGHGIFSTTNSGLSWQPSSVGLTNLKVISLAVPPGKYGDSSVVSGTFGGGVYLSTNRGSSWSSAGLSGKNINAIAANSYFVFAGIDINGGVWMRPNSEILAVERSWQRSPKEMSLDQNFPNPFNPTTSIHYRIANKSHVVLKIFDSIGRGIATIVDDLEQPGEHAQIWDAASFSSGVYFVKLQAGSSIDVKKMLLVR